MQSDRYDGRQAITLVSSTRSAIVLMDIMILRNDG